MPLVQTDTTNRTSSCYPNWFVKMIRKSCNKSFLSNIARHYMVEILLIRRKTLSNQSVTLPWHTKPLLFIIITYYLLVGNALVVVVLCIKHMDMLQYMQRGYRYEKILTFVKVVQNRSCMHCICIIEFMFYTCHS